jgi:hypothetical protein
MKTSHIVSAVLLALIASTASAQTAAPVVVSPAAKGPVTAQRDVNQQNRIEEGLKSGSLSTREAALLERDQAEIDRLQAKSLKDGKLTPAERARLDAAQDRSSKRIARAKHNDVQGNPQSASSQRMQANVQRNANQEARIQQGLQSGELTGKEAAKLERGQARVSAQEAQAGRDGKISKKEQAGIQRAEDRQSKKIYRQKHDAQTKPAA